MSSIKIIMILIKLVLVFSIKTVKLVLEYYIKARP